MHFEKFNPIAFNKRGEEKRKKKNLQGHNSVWVCVCLCPSSFKMLRAKWPNFTSCHFVHSKAVFCDLLKPVILRVTNRCVAAELVKKIRNFRWSNSIVESRWNVMAHGDARDGKWRGNWRMEWVASTLHTTSELGVSSITTADAHSSAASSRLNWRPPPI